MQRVKLNDRDLVVWKVRDLIQQNVMLLSPQNRILDQQHIAKMTQQFKIDYCQPITVYRDGDKYVIVDGQHRYQVLQLIYQDPNHPDHMKLYNWEICLDIHSSGSFDDLLDAFNNRREFNREQIDTGKFTQLVTSLNARLKIDGDSSGKLVRPKTHSPYVDYHKLYEAIQTTRSYLTKTAIQLADLICQINQFLINHGLDQDQGTIWKPKNQGRITPSHKVMQKIVKSRVAIGADPKLSWVILLDLPKSQWSNI